MTSLSHSSKNSRSQELKQGRQQQQLGRQKKKKTIGLNFSKTTTFFSLDMELPNITRPLYGVGEHNTKIFFFLNSDTVLSDSTPENLANIYQIK